MYSACRKPVPRFHVDIRVKRHRRRARRTHELGQDETASASAFCCATAPAIETAPSRRRG